MNNRIKFTSPDSENHEVTLNPNKKLGNGIYGDVYLAENLSKEKFAVKVLNDNNHDDGLSEMNIMKKLTNQNIKNIIPLLGYVKLNDHFVIVMPYAPNGSLDDWLGSDKLQQHQINEIIIGVCNGLHEMHQHDILHRDLKPGNILLTDNMTPLLCDLGFASHENDATFDNGGGSLLFLAPEILFTCFIERNGRKQDKASDIYALGLIIWCVITNSPLPHSHHNRNEFLYQLCIKKYRASIPNEAHKNTAYLIQSLWHHNPRERPTTEGAFKILNNEVTISGEINSLTCNDPIPKCNSPEFDIASIKLSQSYRVWKDKMRSTADIPNPNRQDHTHCNIF